MYYIAGGGRELLAMLPQDRVLHWIGLQILVVLQFLPDWLSMSLWPKQNQRRSLTVVDVKLLRILRLLPVVNTGGHHSIVNRYTRETRRAAYLIRPLVPLSRVKAGSTWLLSLGVARNASVPGADATSMQGRDMLGFWVCGEHRSVSGSPCLYAPEGTSLADSWLSHGLS